MRHQHAVEPLGAVGELFGNGGEMTRVADARVNQRRASVSACE
jgi:hypothetical protein